MFVKLVIDYSGNKREKHKMIVITDTVPSLSAYKGGEFFFKCKNLTERTASYQNWRIGGTSGEE